MKKSLLALALVIVTAVTGLAFSSCSSDSEFPVTAGNITIKAEPKNIIILNKNDADIISCIGYIDKLAGRSDSVNQKGMELVPSVGSANDPSYSKIKKLKADVVFADDTLKSDTKKKLQSSGITVISHEKADTVEQLKKELGYNLDLCGYPHIEEEILDPMDLIQHYQEERTSLNAEIDRVLSDITAILGGNKE